MSETSTKWRTTEIKKLVVKLVNGGTPDTSISSYWNGNIPWVTGADFTSKGIGVIRRYVSEYGVRASSTSVVEPGNLLVVTRTGVGKLAITKEPIAISQDITGVYLDAKQVDLTFFYYLLLSEIEELKKLNQGTSINGIIRSDLEKHKVAIPVSTTQQKRIGKILQNIDRAIESTQALIEKYQLIKAGLMHDLFTRGIGADGKLRPPREAAPELYQETAIGWIPKEWRLVELGRYADICSGVTLGSKQQADQKLKVPYLRVANVQDGYLDLSEVKEIMVNQKTLDALRLQKGDVLMNEGGDFDKLGRGTVWQGEIEPCIHQNHVFRVRVNKELLLPNYLAFWSQSAFGKKYFVLSSKQSTNLASINSSQLHKFPIGLAAINEQMVIEERVNAMNSKIQVLEHEREKLRKQKAGLMHDLLTGKVQVKVDHVLPKVTIP